MFHKVIAGFDGSDRGLDALSLGLALTASEGELIVCCVHRFRSLSARIDPTEPSMDREAAEESVGRAIEGLDRSVPVTMKLVAEASAATALQRMATDEHAELIVLGSSHRGAVGRVLVGSVTEETLHGAPCPVAVAPVGFHTRGTPARLRSVAVGHDVREPTPGALSVGIGLCEETGASLLLAAVAEDATVPDPTRATMPYREAVEARTHAPEQAVAAALDSVPDGLSATGEVRDGDVAEQLLEVAETVDLLVLGSHGRGLIGRLVMGSVCDQVVRAAACAVLIVPSAEITDTRAGSRLAAGTYGLSTESGEPIPDERLETLPTAELTADEQQLRGHI
jgi:nucleotide-binding universal stress UspA family protein